MHPDHPRDPPRLWPAPARVALARMPLGLSWGARTLACRPPLLAAMCDTAQPPAFAAAARSPCQQSAPGPARHWARGTQSPAAGGPRSPGLRLESAALRDAPRVNGRPSGAQTARNRPPAACGASKTPRCLHGKTGRATTRNNAGCNAKHARRMHDTVSNASITKTPRRKLTIVTEALPHTSHRSGAALLNLHHSTQRAPSLRTRVRRACPRRRSSAAS